MQDSTTTAPVRAIKAGGRQSAPGNATQADVSASGKPRPISLDDCRVQNWQEGTMAIMNPDAGLHTQFAWLHGQVGEINDLLLGYISIPRESRERAQGMADALLCHIEMKATVLQHVLEHLCETTDQVAVKAEG